MTGELVQVRDGQLHLPLPQCEVYGTPFSHLFTELKISPIEVHISPIQLKISPNQLEISTNIPI